MRDHALALLPVNCRRPIHGCVVRPEVLFVEDGPIVTLQPDWQPESIYVCT